MTATKGTAKARADAVVREAGAEGHIVNDAPRRVFRTDLVDPVLTFVVYGIPSPQGSKTFKGFAGGKPVLAEQSAGVAPWRDAVRRMAWKAIQDRVKRTGVRWVSLDEPVMVSAVVTMPGSEAARKRGDVYAPGTPDLDKLERAIGDALAPTPLSPAVGKGMTDAMKRQVRDKTMADRRSKAVLHDDSRIVVWDHVCKVNPGTTVDSLGYPGALIRIWKMADLEQAARKPVVTVGAAHMMQAQDMRAWGRPLSGLTWDQEAERQWKSPEAVFAASGPVLLRGQGVDDNGVKVTLKTLALTGPTALMEVQAAVNEHAR